MSVDNLSISFASSMGIGNIKDEFMNENINLYTDLDDLEKSVEAEFEQYMNQARSFPFHQSRDHPALKDASVHSDYDILGAELLDKVNVELAEDDESWHRYLERNEVDNNYNVKPLRNKQGSVGRSDQYYNGTNSPGAYFAARSLPLNSMDNVWQQEQELSTSLRQDSIHQKDHEDIVNEEYTDEEDVEQEDPISFISSTKESNYKSATEELLEARFKSLPRNIRLFPKYDLPDIKLHHPYTQKSRSATSSVSSTHQQCSASSRGKQYTENSSRNSSRGVQSLSSFHSPSSLEEPPCIIEPSSPLHFLCEIGSKTIYAKVVHLKITNSSPNIVRSFSLFSRNNLLEFEVTEGMILEHEVVDIKIKIQSNALSSYQKRQHEEFEPLHDKVLVLIDRQYVNELDVQIDFISLEDDDEEEIEKSPKRPKCKYCALEKGFPLHCL